MSDVESKIREIIAREAEVPPESIRRESTLADLEIESVDLVQIMFLIEEEFDIYLADEELGFDVENVGEVYDAVSRLLAQKSQAAAGA